MKQTRKRFTKEFKENIINQLKSGFRVIDLAGLYNISDEIIQQWKSNTLKWKDDYTVCKIFGII